MSNEIEATLNKQLADRLKDRKTLSNKQLVKSLLRDPVFWFMLGMILSGVYAYSKAPRYLAYGYKGYNLTDEVEYNGVILNYYANTQDLWCNILIQSKNYSYTWSWFNPKPIPASLLYLVNKTNPIPQLCGKE